mmetsp:Transcript_32814/g.37979  ORF Transcript_32814/g.37979 Transcript_32814/m.37979 type:complete len:80 (+) Transcript_32814:1292-1531(+)
MILSKRLMQFESNEILISHNLAFISVESMKPNFPQDSQQIFCSKNPGTNLTHGGTKQARQQGRFSGSIFDVPSTRSIIH